MRTSGFRYLALIFGLLLLVTGGLKTHAAFSDKPIDSYLVTNRWELLAIAEFELFLGGWLMSGVYPRLARPLAALTFLCFLAVSLMTAFRGERSCACFGELHVSPWIAAFIDFTASIALLLCRPGANASTVPTSSLRRSLLGTFTLALLAPPIALALNDSARSPLLISSQRVMDLGVLTSGEWRDASLYLTNKGDAPVEVGAIASSCRCLSVKCIPQVVPPGGTAQMIVVLDLGKEPDFVGKLRIHVQGRTRSGTLAFSVQVRAQVQEPRFRLRSQDITPARKNRAQ